jgi:hypothetical protein
MTQTIRLSSTNLSTVRFPFGSANISGVLEAGQLVSVNFRVFNGEHSVNLSQPVKFVLNSIPVISLLNSSEPLAFPENGPQANQVFVLNVSDADDDSLSVHWSVDNSNADSCPIANGIATCTLYGSDLRASAGTITFTVSDPLDQASVNLDFTSGTYQYPDIYWQSYPPSCTADALSQTSISFSVIYNGPGVVRVDYSFSVEDFEVIEQSVLVDSVTPGEVVINAIGEKIGACTLPSEGEAMIVLYTETIYGSGWSQGYEFQITIPEAPHLNVVAPQSGSLGIF